MARPTTLWGGAAPMAAELWEFTAGRDRPWDARLLRWDVLGSLAHVEALRRARLLAAGEHAELRRLLRRALAEVDAGRLVAGQDQEDVHTAVEAWLTRRARGAGERLHTGRSRNDQVATDLRLWLKDALLGLHADAEALAGALLRFAGRHRSTLWPGYTHTRRAMPSTAALWSAALAEGLVDSLGGAAGFCRSDSLGHKCHGAIRLAAEGAPEISSASCGKTVEIVGLQVKHHAKSGLLERFAHRQGTSPRPRDVDGGLRRRSIGATGVPAAGSSYPPPDEPGLRIP